MDDYPPLRITILGSGTSTGIPVINCACKVCNSEDPRNKRLRTSVKIEAAGRTIMVDCGVDFRQQMLRYRTPRIDAVLLTHTHADHVHGLDDLRAFTFRQPEPIPIFSTDRFITDVRSRFGYCFNPVQVGGGVPRLELKTVEPGQIIDVMGLPALTIGIMHGKLPILGFRLGRFAYLTDCSLIPPESLELLRGVDTLILTALRHEPHPTHFSVSEALAASERIGVRRVYFIHMACRLDHAETEAQLPDWARLSYDGMVIEVG